ncbi:hypothetical protein [Geochorda subterranea]|uniref:Glycosyl transferase family 2 n=1 Tax=Geochorda subterranea TaxID=3109564 RepID=A0ABZ1BPB5_9FIRM|nr:hypothetical protein [Limnochorda sp. LNt]WRP14308.1 hypothetical protein VLY81_12930 [Limnochorda sp. LNt]
MTDRPRGRKPTFQLLEAQRLGRVTEGLPEPLLLLVTLVALLVWLSGLDDLAFDAVYVLRARRIRRSVRLHDLSAGPFKRIAVFVPAWQEALVIGEMLRTTLELVNYPRSRYTVFVGTYPNAVD